MGKVYGYARCSTSEKRQDVERQVAELYAMGADFVVQEYGSGANAERKGFLELMAALADGDTLYATEVSRVTRSLAHLCEIIGLAKRKRLVLKFGALSFDCSAGKLEPFPLAMLQIMGVFAELERNVAAERISSGLEHAKANGVQLGRPKKTVEEISPGARRHWEKFKNGEVSLAGYARLAGLHRSTAYKYAKLLESAKEKES